MGAWLALVYAFMADWINRAFMPGIPLADPEGGIFTYLLASLLIGALIGLVCCWPHNAWVGSLLGGLVSALLVFIGPWQRASGSPEETIGTLFLTLYTFMPLLVILTPAAFFIRYAVSHFPTQKGEAPQKRFYAVIAGVTLTAVILGVFSLYPEEVRYGFQITNTFVIQSMKAGPSRIPEKLQYVKGFYPNANGRYTLSYSQDVEAYMGPRPVTARLNSDFLIITKYDNGFTFACVTAPGLKEPASCTNWP